MNRVRPAIPRGSLAGSSGRWLARTLLIGATVAAAVQCAVPPSEDCSVKATCTAAQSEAGIDPLADAGPGTADTGHVGGLDATVVDANGDPTSGDAGDASDTVEQIPCGTGYTCVPMIPFPWGGPFAEWNGPDTAAPPSCPSTYNWPMDTYSGLNFSPATCSCTCEPTGQTCTASASIYGSGTCTNAPCATVSVSSACSVVSGCTGSQGTLRADTPTPAGGSCVPTIPKVTPSAVTWTTAYRLCLPEGTEHSYYCEGDDICTPNPPSPFQARLCIGQIVPAGATAPTSCPTGYPNGPSISYWNSSDTRGCAPCSCTTSAPTGGSCAGTLSLTGADEDDCTTNAIPYTIGSGCSAQFSLLGAVARIAGNYTVAPGTCAVSADGGTYPTGTVQVAGSTQVICCM